VRHCPQLKKTNILFNKIILEVIVFVCIASSILHSSEKEKIASVTKYFDRERDWVALIIY
jgi:hypothetical protein